MTRRTTISADVDDLEVLEGVARRRGVSLAQVIRELVADKAAEVRRTTRPRFGVVAIGSSDGVALSARSWRDEDSPARGG